MSHSHDIPLVALSIAIAIMASYAALDLAGRVTAAQGRSRRLWLLGWRVCDGHGNLVHSLRGHARPPASLPGSVPHPHGELELMGDGNNLAGAGKVFKSLIESLDGLRGQLTLVMQAPR